MAFNSVLSLRTISQKCKNILTSHCDCLMGKKLKSRYYLHSFNCYLLVKNVSLQKPPFTSTNLFNTSVKTSQDAIKIIKSRESSNIKQEIKEAKEKVKEKLDEIIEKEKIWTIPNILCLSRIAVSPFICYSIVTTNYSMALGMLFVAGFTDLMDGTIARVFPNQASRLGTFLDPFADKILVASLFVTLTYMNLIPLSLTCLIVSRDILIICGASYVRYKSLPPPFTLSRYFDATHATVELKPTLISKINTALQLCLTTASLAAPVFQYTDHYLLSAFCWVTAGSTILSGLSYIFSSNTYKILKKK